MKVLLSLAALAFLVAPVVAQQAPAPPPTYEQATANSWRRVHDKLLAMAKDFPEDKLGWKPHADSRSVAEELRHVTIGLKMNTAMLKGERPNYQTMVKEDAAKPAARASIVAEMEAAIAESYPLVQSTPSPRLIGWLEHQGEHYGKLVNAYRSNGLVPPVSRAAAGG
ncbi:MAG: DinB family protein [Acidobacteriota bacterium]|nr:DinB family protein [Acidobacteriota bacterium]